MRLALTARIGAAGLTLASASLARAATIHVPTDYGSIDQAVDAASDGDEIVLAQMNHFAIMQRTKGKAITIRREDPTDRNVVANTIVTAENQMAVFWITDHEGPDTILDGANWSDVAPRYGGANTLVSDMGAYGGRLGYHRFYWD